MTRWLVGYDGSPHSERALAWAVARAKADGGSLVLATVVPSSLKDSFLTQVLLPGLDLPTLVKGHDYHANAKHALDAAASGTGLPAGRVETRVLTGEAWHALVQAAGEIRPDGLVVGVKSYEKIAENQVGAVADRIVRHATVPVVVVR